VRACGRAGVLDLRIQRTAGRHQRLHTLNDRGLLGEGWKGDQFFENVISSDSGNLPFCKRYKAERSRRSHRLRLEHALMHRTVLEDQYGAKRPTAPAAGERE